MHFFQLLNKIVVVKKSTQKLKTELGSAQQWKKKFKIPENKFLRVSIEGRHMGQGCGTKDSFVHHTLYNLFREI